MPNLESIETHDWDYNDNIKEYQRWNYIELELHENKSSGKLDQIKTAPIL